MIPRRAGFVSVRWAFLFDQEVTRLVSFVLENNKKINMPSDEIQKDKGRSVLLCHPLGR